MSTVFTQVSEFLNDRSLRDQGRCPMLVVSSSENFWADANSKFIGPNQSDDPNKPVYYVRSKETFIPMDQKALSALVRLAPQHKPPQWLIGILTRVSPEETSLAHEQNAWPLEVYKNNIEVVTSVNPDPNKKSEVASSPKRVQFADPIQQTAVIIPDDTKVIPQEVVASQPQRETETPTPKVEETPMPTAPPSSPKKVAPLPIVAVAPASPMPTPIPTPKVEEQPKPKPMTNPETFTAKPTPRPTPRPMPKAPSPKHNQQPVQHLQKEEEEEQEEQVPVKRTQPKAASTGFKVFGYEVSAPLAFALGTAAVAGGFYCWYKFGNASTKQPAKTPATQAAFAPQSPVFRTYYI